jgi:hypothetical protein
MADMDMDYDGTPRLRGTDEVQINKRIIFARRGEKCLSSLGKGRQK